MKTLRIVLVALLALAVIGVVARWGMAGAATFNPTLEVTLSDYTAGANADVTNDFSIPGGDANYDLNIAFTPAEFGLGAGVPLGAHVADLESLSTLGLLNNPCETGLPVSFEMLNASLDTADTLTFDESYVDLDGNGLPDGAEKYPDFLNTLFPGLTPTMRMFGVTSAAGTAVTMNMVIFDPGTTLYGIAFDPALGRPSVQVLNDPTAASAPNPITDWCTPLSTTITTFGISEDNPDTAGDESGYVVSTNPTTPGDYTFTAYAASQYDADGDGLDNTLDTCPYDVDTGLDDDNDGLDNVCDPDPAVASAGLDEDADGYMNRGDNCPLADNYDQADADGDGIGAACDTDNGTQTPPNGDQVPDGVSIEVYVTDTVAIRGMGATITVNSTGDSNAPDGLLTLREAMLLATGGLAMADLDSGECAQVSNSTYGPPCSTTDSIGEVFADAIVFETIVFPPSMPATITLGSVLPKLSTGGDTVDGASAGVIIDGDDKSFDCFEITSDGNTIKGLEIYNCSDGVSIHAGARCNTIGGTTSAERNVISGNGNYGVLIYESGTKGNVVKGNYIGTDASGSAPIPNDWYGVYVTDGAQNNTVGGSSPGEGNVISGNGYYGVGIWGSGTKGNVVKGNYIGTDASGMAAIPNGWAAVAITGGAQKNTVGGSSPGEGNLISGNGYYGVVIYESGTNGNVVKGNYIGTDASGSAPIPNDWYGVYVTDGAQNNTVGGSSPGEGNIIAFNMSDGVCVNGATTTGNTIRGNFIHSNGGKGIENINGGNTELAPPTITGTGSVSGSACFLCWVEVFSDEEDEGRMFLLPPVRALFVDWVVPGYAIGPNVTATATDADGNTSEFSVPFACGNDSDGDNIGDACDPAPGSTNADADGFDDYVEAYIGTDPLDDCPDVVGTPGLCPGPSCDGHDAWPPDLDIDREADIADVLKFKPYILTLAPPSPQRFDFDADGEIDIADVLKYKPIILTSCTNP